MSEIKDYIKLTLEDLLIEQKKIKKQQMYAAGMIGVFLGIILFGLVINGFGWVYISISVALIYLINDNSKKNKQNLEQIKNEINIRNAA